MAAAVGVELPEEGLRARPHARCFACGQDNPAGLQIPFRRLEGGAAAEWTPAPAWEGFRGIVHGGLVSTVLDEAMSKAVAAAGSEALTAELRVRFRLPVRTGETFTIRGWIVRRNKRLIETEAVVTGAGGVEHAHGWGRFLALAGPR